MTPTHNTAVAHVAALSDGVAVCLPDLTATAVVFSFATDIIANIANPPDGSPRPCAPRQAAGDRGTERVPEPSASHVVGFNVGKKREANLRGLPRLCQNVEGLVLGWIEADFCNQCCIIILI